jgi:hypothetical protein
MLPETAMDLNPVTKSFFPLSSLLLIIFLAGEQKMPVKSSRVSAARRSKADLQQEFAKIQEQVESEQQLKDPKTEGRRGSARRRSGRQPPESQ